MRFNVDYQTHTHFNQKAVNMTMTVSVIFVLEEYYGEDKIALKQKTRSLLNVTNTLYSAAGAEIIEAQQIK